MQDNTLKFSDEQQIEIIKKHGYEIRLTIKMIHQSSYHNKIDWYDKEVYSIYKDNEELEFIWHSGSSKHSQVNYIFDQIYHDMIFKMMINV